MTGVRLVALGDSVSAGLGDPMPDGSWRGWARLLAEALGPAEFHNLAEPGALTHTLVDRQLPTALSLRPTLATVLIGVNDTLRGSFDVRRTGRALECVTGELRRAGAVVLTARLPDPGRMLRLPASLARPLGRRAHAVNAVADAVAVRHDTVHLDLTAHPGTYQRRMWSVDRFHPSEAGHRLLARAFAELLAARGFPVERSLATGPSNPPPTPLATLRWMATKGTGWVLRRSTDLVPHLVAMAVAEWWYDVRGIAARLDQQLRAEVERAVAAMPSTQISPYGAASVERGP